MLLHSLKFFEQLSVSLFASFLLITDFLPLNFQPTCFHFTSERSWMQCFISDVNVSFNTYMYTIIDSGMTLSFHLSLKVVLIYNKNKSLRVRQLGLAVSYQELNNVWWSWLSRILQATPLQETELLSCEDFNIWKTKILFSLHMKCKRPDWEEPLLHWQ